MPRVNPAGETTLVVDGFERTTLATVAMAGAESIIMTSTCYIAKFERKPLMFFIIKWCRLLIVCFNQNN